MDESWVLVDSRTRLHVAWYFWLRVLDEVNRSQRYGEPFALLLLEGSVPAGRPAKLIEEAAAHVPALIRATDVGGLAAPGRVGLLLTHQDHESASAARERILEDLAAAGPRDVRWRDRMLTYPADAAEISSLLTTGWATGSTLARPASA